MLKKDGSGEGEGERNANGVKRVRKYICYHVVYVYEDV